MEALEQSLESISERLYTYSEFPLINREILPKTIIPEILQLGKAELDNYAIRLAGKFLDGLLYDLIDCQDQKAIDRANIILRLRFSPRLVKLTGRLFQYNFHSMGLKQACKALTEEGNRRGLLPVEGLFVFRFASQDDVKEALIQAADEEGRDLSHLCKSYYIDPDSPLARKSFFSYLVRGGKKELLTNKDWLLFYLETEDLDTLIPLIRNYLSSLTLAEYSRRINLKITERMGDPYESVDWETFTRQERQSFAQWNFLYKLKVHSQKHPQKYKILSRYYDNIRSCKISEDGRVLIIDFGDIVILDPKDRLVSYFCNKEFFLRSLDNSDGDSELLLSMIDKKGPTISARDFIIEKREEKCIKLSYEGIDSLYINGMLDIKMGLEPDMRRQKVISRFRGQRRYPDRGG